MKFAAIKATHYHLPTDNLDNVALEAAFENFPREKILEKTGIQLRHLADRGECSSDLAVEAAEGLFTEQGLKRDTIDTLILCTQTPDYFLPTTACLLQERLRLSTKIAAFDINLGCSGYVYGLGLAKALIETDQAENLLLLTADTYSKMLRPEDRNVRSLFGDAASATLLSGQKTEAPKIGPFVYGTDGSGAPYLIAEAGAFRALSGEIPGAPQLYMDGPQIFHFTLGEVPRLVEELITKADISLEQVDLFVFHQANRFMLEHLREKISIPKAKFLIAMESCGNTVSSSIPIALHDARKAGRLISGMKVMLVGFGVGYSWGATIVEWD